MLRFLRFLYILIYHYHAAWQWPCNEIVNVQKFVVIRALIPQMRTDCYEFGVHKLYRMEHRIGDQLAISVQRAPGKKKLVREP